MRPKNLINILVVFCLFSGHAPLHGQHSFSKNKTIVIAHRGDHTRAPENTLKAYENAIESGVDFIEVDLRTTKDGELVVMHDATIDRMTDGKGTVSDLSFTEVRRLKVADKNHPEWGTYPIPTFNEVLRTCKGRVNIYLDFKNASVEKTYEAIQNAGMEKSIVVYLNAREDYAAWRKVAPHMPLMISLPEKMDNLTKLKDYLEEMDAEILDGSYAEYTKEKVDLIHKMKRLVWVDVQQRNETPDQWSRAISTGMDGLQTDHPHDLIAYLKHEGIR